jgi:predicted kinase
MFSGVIMKIKNPFCYLRFYLSLSDGQEAIGKTLVRKGNCQQIVRKSAMRILVIMRGLPGSGKSSWIRENGLEPFTLSTDSLRLLYSAPVLNLSGQSVISQRVNKLVFAALDKLLAIRMKNGDLTVVDACHVREEDFLRYRDLIREYRYRALVADFSDVPLEECKRRNRLRDEMRLVPEADIDRMHSMLIKTKLPGWVQVFSHNDRITL